MDKIHGLYANIRVLEQEDLFRHFLYELSEERQQRILARGSVRARAQSLGAWTLVDRLLYAHAGVRERELGIACGTHGKPYAPQQPALHFNLSHSGELAFAVLSPVTIGCDVQSAQENGREAQLARRFFSEEEQAAYDAGLDFYRIFTRKESWIKCDGLGMAQELCAFSVAGAADPKQKTYEKGWQWRHTAGRHFVSMHTQGYELALCYASQETYPVQLSQADLPLLYEKDCAARDERR